jgi:hypothetical protein
MLTPLPLPLLCTLTPLLTLPPEPLLPRPLELVDGSSGWAEEQGKGSRSELAVLGGLPAGPPSSTRRMLMLFERLGGKLCPPPVPTSDNVMESVVIRVGGLLPG